MLFEVIFWENIYGLLKFFEWLLYIYMVFLWLFLNGVFIVIFKENYRKILILDLVIKKVYKIL